MKNKCTSKSVYDWLKPTARNAPNHQAKAEGLPARSSMVKSLIHADRGGMIYYKSRDPFWFCPYGCGAELYDWDANAVHKNGCPYAIAIAAIAEQAHKGEQE